jgi:type IV secretion system protein VirB9
MRLSRLALVLILPGTAAAQTVPPLAAEPAGPVGVTAAAPASSSVSPLVPSLPASSEANGLHDRTPPPLNLLSGKEARLNELETQSLIVSRDWINRSETPGHGDDGRVLYTYGATLPSIVCAPLHVCDIELEPGEVVNDINAGDPVRWKISPATSGSGERKTTHILVKPTDSALTTNLDVATDRRMYVIQLVSRTKDWMPLVAFSYPDDQQARWAAYHQAAEQQKQAAPPPAGESVSQLDFDFRVKGPAVTWKPIRVYTTGSKTYVQFAGAVTHDDLPALVALGTSDAETLVNYRLVDDRFEVDRLLRHAALIRGVGRHQQRVEITYSGKL